MPASAARRRDRLRSLTVRGVQVRVSVRPARGRLAAEPPLLLCNGIGASLEVLQPLVDALDPDRGVIRFDVPGVGGSPLPRTPYVLASLAPWVAAVAAQLGHRELDVLGLSWGGGLAQQLAVQCRRRVRRVVLVATGTGSLMVPAHPRVLAKMFTPRRHRDPTYARLIAAEIYGGSVRTDPARAAELLHAATRAGPRRGYYYQLAATAGWTSLPCLPLLRQPTLLLAGDDDPIVPLVNAKVMARLIPRSRLHVYAGGHLGVLTESAELAPVVDAFLSGPAPAVRQHRAE
ncbi:poly(3-hydroxyalkanoate) depolymerase [soil metagenome]